MCLSSPEMTPKCGKNVKIDLKTPKKQKLNIAYFVISSKGVDPHRFPSRFLRKLVRFVNKIHFHDKKCKPLLPFIQQ